MAHFSNLNNFHPVLLHHIVVISITKSSASLSSYSKYKKQTFVKIATLPWLMVHWWLMVLLLAWSMRHRHYDRQRDHDIRQLSLPPCHHHCHHHHGVLAGLKMQPSGMVPTWDLTQAVINSEIASQIQKLWYVGDFGLPMPCSALFYPILILQVRYEHVLFWVRSLMLLL